MMYLGIVLVFACAWLTMMLAFAVFTWLSR